MAPGLRLGWLRAPAALRRACVIAKQAADLHTSDRRPGRRGPLSGGRDLDAHLTRVRDAYRERRDALSTGCPPALPPGCTWNRPQGGMFVWARLPGGVRRDGAAARGRRAGRRLRSWAPFFAGSPDPAACGCRS